MGEDTDLCMNCFDVFEAGSVHNGLCATCKEIMPHGKKRKAKKKKARPAKSR